MHRIDTPGSVSGMFSSGNPFQGIEGTVVGFEWLNAVQEELAGIVELAPVLRTLDKADNTQVRLSILDLIDVQTGRVFTFTATEDLTAGEGYLFRDTFGVVLESVLNTETATIERSGPFTLVKNNTEPITRGDRVYWDQAGREVRNTSGGGVYIGIADSTELAAAVTVDVIVGQPQNV